MTTRQFSVISPVYNVARYLPDYFASLQAQTVGIESLDITLVDDGSTDESLRLCEEFARKFPNNVRVIHKENGGQASARNRGLTLASGQWVCFPDPDDTLSSNFFEEIREYMGAPESRNTVLFAGHIIMWHESPERFVDNHPTSFRFRLGNSTTNLIGKPNFIHGNAVMSFFKREVIQNNELKFDEKLRSRFEDGNFISRYLLAAPAPVIGLVSEAHYFYRQRSDGSSTVQNSKADSRSYTDVPKSGYLNALLAAQQSAGEVPRWLQTLVIYDILWMFKSDSVNPSGARSQAPEVLAAFHRTLEEVMDHIEPEVVLGFDMMRVPLWMKEALAYGYSEERYLGNVYVGPTDADRNLLQIRYRYTGTQPREDIYVRGELVEPRFAKTQLRRTIGHDVIKERRLWVTSLGVIRFELDGKPQPLLTKEVDSSNFKFRRSQVLEAEANQAVRGIPPRFQKVHGRMSSHLARATKNWAKKQAQRFELANIQDVFLGITLRQVWIRRRYLDAWVLMDKDNEANDSAEQLYRWIRENKSDTKIWYVLRRDSPDWSRLSRDGFKLIEFGSYRWRLLLLSAAHVISSHVDHYISNPLPASRYGKPQWKLTFLQHGIIKGDLSHWLNGKNIDLFATSTQAEHDYISGTSPFRFGPREVKLTGLPRHDALLEKSSGIAAGEINQIVIAPTWRQYLVGAGKKTITDRELNPNFASSEFAHQWKSLLHSEGLRDYARRNDLKIVFLPHPNIQPYLSSFDVPDDVVVQKYGDNDIQDIICRSSVMITDYSSQAFNMAYLGRPVVYFQFDKEIYEAEHTEGKAYYDYETDGFGPVVSTCDEVVNSLHTLENNPSAKREFVARTLKTFPVKDGKNSERVFNAIRQLDRPLSFSRGSVAAARDQW
ncbi:CDP-glycerol glycerophosphotransferase family protein [Homoserinimonas sp. OAct 916]|uniref:bifunctional glycosyltransferase/CDP-glycerol:glycerophosphate glycerophosphotransferase n=1 Tax=Homoserinimonas sp. OAct 916 TaxID=2211450 RepID=UPI000DBE9534|nr:CDP-glycerol glycerophosphotransferase family protein [Homoserinimonas sp. OAct 916]